MPSRALNLKEERGVEVDHVEDEGPAAKAGMKQGDVVLEYNGEKVEAWSLRPAPGWQLAPPRKAGKSPGLVRDRDAWPWGKRSKPAPEGTPR